MNDSVKISYPSKLLWSWRSHVQILDVYLVTIVIQFSFLGEMENKKFQAANTYAWGKKARLILNLCHFLDQIFRYGISERYDSIIFDKLWKDVEIKFETRIESHFDQISNGAGVVMREGRSPLRIYCNIFRIVKPIFLSIPRIQSLNWRWRNSIV